MAPLLKHEPLTVERTALPLEIHAATKSYHTVLNRAIIPRLSLCLPPHATTPAVYADGMACFGRIYFLFESLWEEILEDLPDDSSLLHALEQLKLPSLLRSARLKADLSLLDERCVGQDRSCKDEDDELGRLLDHTRDAILGRPYLIMSYCWVMYLALFNGGRWIRGRLEQAGPEFWGTQPRTESSQMEVLSFWDFEGDQDGEDIKIDFKARFDVAAAALDDNERHDVVEECIRVLETCSQMVAWLDKQTQPASAEVTISEA